MIGLIATAMMVALHVVTQSIDFGFFNLRIRDFNADKRDSVFGLASLLAQAAVAALCLWRGRQATGHRRVWSVLGALVGVLVIVRGLTTFNATALAVPLACVFGLVCWLTWRDSGGVRVVVWAGLILMATSLLLHKVGLASDASTASDFTWSYQIISMVKHGAELAGWMLLATAVAAGIKSLPEPAATPDRTVAPELESLAG